MGELSAALEMSTVLALAKIYGIEKDNTTLAKIGQKAEHTFAGCPCGLLDQASSLYGKEGALVKSDFRTCEFENVPMGDGVAFMMVKSNAKHALVDGAYASRRQACEDAAKYFAGVLKHPVTHLRDVTCAEWVLYRGGLPETTAKRAIHPIGEDERVLKGAELLEKGDVAGFGSLMFDSHESSRNWFENSCEELDTIVDAAKAMRRRSPKCSARASPAAGSAAAAACSCVPRRRTRSPRRSRRPTRPPTATSRRAR